MNDKPILLKVKDWVDLKMSSDNYSLPARVYFNSHSGICFYGHGIVYDVFRVTVNLNTWLIFERDKTDKSRFVATGFTQEFSETVPILNDTVYSLIEQPASGASRIWDN